MQCGNHSSMSYSIISTLPTNYIVTFLKPFSLVWYVIPLLKTGFLASTCDLFLRFWRWIHQKKHRSHVQFMLSDIILAQWQRSVASSEALDLLHWEMRVVTYRCIAMAIKTATFFWCICWLLFVCLLPWRPLGWYRASSCPMAASRGI